MTNFNTKYTNKRRNKSIKNIPQFNNKGFFNTQNPTLLKNRYDLLFNTKQITKIIETGKKMMEALGNNKTKEIQLLRTLMNEQCSSQINWLLNNKKQIKKFFDYSSIDKKNKNQNFFNTFSNNIFLPYYEIGNKYQTWFNEFYDFISEFPSLYNYDKKIVSGVAECVRFTDKDERIKWLKDGKNQNPSWSFGSTSYESFKLNPLFEGKDYEYLYSLYQLNDVIYDTGFEDRENDKNTEREVFIRKNAETIMGGVVFTYGFKDIQKYFPFVPDNYRLKKSKKLYNGFGMFDVFLNSFPREEIEKYGTLTKNNDGNFSYLPKNPSLFFEQQLSIDNSSLEFYTEMKNSCLKSISNTPYETSWNNWLRGMVKKYEDKINFWKKECIENETMIEMCKNNQYKLTYKVSSSTLPQYKGVKYPGYLFDNNRFFCGNARID